MIPHRRRAFAAKHLERRSVTVCIAAACHDEATAEHKIILCTDWRVSGALGSAEIKLKQRPLRKGWNILTAGEDGEINAFTNLLSNRVRTADNAGNPIDDTNIPNFVRESLAERKRQKIDEFVRGQYAMPYDDLLSIGKDKLPTEAFRDAMYSVRDIGIEADFIIAGFSSGYPFLVQTEGASKVHVREGFAVAGEGAYLAQTVLLNRSHMDVNSVEKTLYLVYEAKRYAEGATSVGEATAIQILSKDGSKKYLLKKGIDMLKNQYKKYGPQNVPEELDALAEGMFKNYEP